MKKHRIYDVCTWQNELSVGFHLFTKNGIASIPVTCRPGKEKQVSAILKKHLPHLAEEIVQQNGWSREELKNLLIGRYCYGRAQTITNSSGFTERRIT